MWHDRQLLSRVRTGTAVCIVAASGLVLPARADFAPVAGDWQFRIDAEDRGVADGWYLPAEGQGTWTLLPIGRPWHVEPARSTRIKGWYRKAIHIPLEWRGRFVYLGVESVEESYDLYVNGHRVRNYAEGNPFARAATATRVDGFLRCGEDNWIALRISGPVQGGGLTGRVALSTDARSLNWEPLVHRIEEVRFSVDADGRGLAEGRHAAAFDDSSWSVRALSGDGWRKWEDTRDYRGDAWYRLPLKLPDAWPAGEALLATPNVDGRLAIYVNGRLALSRGFAHDPGFPRAAGFRELEVNDKQRPTLDIASALGANDNVLAIRVKCEGDRRGVRGPVVLAADRRALVFQNDWKAVTELARAEPELILPGWATGRGVTRTIAGTIGGESECFVAPDGSFSPSNRSFGVTAWVYDCSRERLHAGERVPLADLQWKLDGGGRYPFPQSRWRAGDVNVETLLFAKQAKIGEDRPDLAFYRCRLTNTGDTRAQVRLYVAVVPFSIDREYYAFARGYNPVRQLAYRPDWQAALVNNQLGVVSLERPQAFGCTSMVGGSFISEHAIAGELPVAQQVEDWAGLASGALRFDVELEPQKSVEFPFILPINGLPPDESTAGALRQLDWKKSYNEARDEWKRIWDQQAIRITLPETDIEEAFYASLAYALVLKDGDGLIPGSFAYNAFWTRDAAYLIDACLRAGLTETARKATELWVGFQKESGQFPSMGPGGPKEWDGQGQAMFSFVQVYRYTHDRQWLARHFDNLLRGARYIARIRSEGMTEANRDTPRWGILTPSTSAEDLGPKEWHFYWDDFWCIRGLQDALFAAGELGEAAAAGEIRQILDDLQGSTLASIRRVIAEQKIDWIPVAPESASASGKARGTTPAAWPGGALEPDDPLVRRSFDHYWETLIAPKDGGYYHGGQPWPYATLEMAHAYLNLGQVDRAYRMLRWTLDRQSAPGVYAWAEVADGGNQLFLGGDLPHGWACAEYVSLVRDMLVREVGDAVWLTSGVPGAWLAHGKRVEVERAPTHFGRLAYKIASRSAAGEVSMSIRTDARPPDGIVWCIPPLDAPIEQVVFDAGGPSEQRVELPSDRRLRIPPDVQQVTLRLRTTVADVMTEPYRARMAQWKSGLSQSNLYASIDDKRPLLGVYFYFDGADARTNRDRLGSVREAFDFVQIGPNSGNVRRCEEIGMPWMGVEQPAIPLGRDSPQWNDALGVIRSRIADYGDGYYLLGWNSGSEPHTSHKSPGYTGHTQKLYDELGVAAPTRDEFVEWLSGEYADESPSADSNGDGITFNRDFGVSFGSWDAVAQPANRRLPWFEHVMIPFTSKLIRDAEAGRLDAFRRHDPAHKVTPRLLRSLTDPRMSYDLTYLDLGDAAGVTFYCGGGFDMDDPHDTGTRVETQGLWHDGAFRFGLRMTPPHKNTTGLAQSAYSVLLPEGRPVLFRTSLKDNGPVPMTCRVEVVEDLSRPDAPGRVLLSTEPAPVFKPIEVDLSDYAGRRVWLRLITDPGRQAAVPASASTGAPGPVYWLEPRIEVAGVMSSDLVEFYKEARAGYRTYDSQGEPGTFVFLGLRGSMYQAWYADHVMSLVANRARLAGKRAVANEFHPGSGSPHAMFPLAIYDSMIRLMQFRVPSVAYFCHMYQGEFMRYSMANSEEHVARARNQAILWDLYPRVPARRHSRVACFMPSNFATPQQADEAAAQFGTKGKLVWAMGELGADFYLLNDLDQARDYDRIVIFLAYADRQAEEKLFRALDTDQLAGKRVLVLTGVSTLWGPVGRRHSRAIDASCAEVLPVTPAGKSLVSKSAQLLPGLRADMRIAESVRVQDRAGFEPIKADDGTVVGARSGNLLCLAGFPETPLDERLARGWFDTTLRRLVHRWLEVDPGEIHVGDIHIITRDQSADAPGIYCIENSSVVSVGQRLAAYDVLHRRPVADQVFGPAVIRVWPSAQPRLVDTDLCEPMNVSETEDAVSAVVISPSFLKSLQPGRIVVYSPGESPLVELDGQTVRLEPLGRGCHAFTAPPPGTHRLSMQAAGVR